MRKEGREREGEEENTRKRESDLRPSLGVYRSLHKFFVALSTAWDADERVLLPVLSVRAEQIDHGTDGTECHP